MRGSATGPFYGAKSSLFGCSLVTMLTAQSAQIVHLLTIPTGEDWYLTTVMARAGTAGSAAGTVDVLDDGVSALPAVLTLSTAGTSKNTTTTSGEDEGIRMATGSVITVVITSSATTAPGNINITAFGYIRNVR